MSQLSFSGSAVSAEDVGVVGRVYWEASAADANAEVWQR